MGLAKVGCEELTYATSFGRRINIPGEEGGGVGKLGLLSHSFILMATFTYLAIQWRESWCSIRGRKACWMDGWLSRAFLFFFSFSFSNPFFSSVSVGRMGHKFEFK